MLRLPDLRSLAVAGATALVILALVVAPFLSPPWISFEQGRADAAAWTRFSAADLRTATDAILTDLVIGPPAFDVSIAGVPVLTAAERSHMQDVRAVFSGFYVAAGVGLAILIVGLLATRRSRTWTRANYLGAIRSGAAGLAVALVAAGIIAALAFDAAFEVFHRLFFAAGTYNFDPRTNRLVQLFPDAFWSETSLAVGGVALVAALMVYVGAGRRRRSVADGLRSRPEVVPTSSAVPGRAGDG